MMLSVGAQRMINSRMFGATHVRPIGRPSSAPTPITPYSLTFDGSNDYISLGNNYDKSSGTWSVSAWFKPTNTGLRMEIIGKRNGTNAGWQVGLIGTGANLGKLSLNIAESSTIRWNYRTTNAATFAAWNHVLVVFSFTLASLKIYLNGVNETLVNNGSAGTPTTASNSENLIIGAIASGSYFSGFLDQTAIWNSDQSANAAAIYALKPANLPDLSPYSPASWWPIGEANDVWGGSGGILDRIGTIHGTMTNFDPAGSFSTDVAS